MNAGRITLPESAAARLRALGAGWRTRFAPAPTGYLHLGHVVNALYVWEIARAHGGHVVLRIEDHDRTRCRPEYEAALLEDVAWLGFMADEGPEGFRQSDRGARYTQVLTDLERRALAYPCRCSRRDIAREVPDRPNEEMRYPGTCRHAAVPPGATAARRLVVHDGNERFDDLLLDAQLQHPADQCGDVLLRDRNGNWTYQFCVVVDDMDQGVDVVIRGTDLLESTGRQLQLARMLGRKVPPLYLHHPLVTHPDGAKLSKSNRDTGVRDLRAQGVSAEDVLARARALLAP